MKHQNPAKFYLLSLESAQSRGCMQSYVLRALDIFQPGSDLVSFDWASLTHDSLSKLRDSLNKGGKAPATIAWRRKVRSACATGH